MKRFLVFVLICIVVASLGILTYNFLAVEETVSVNQTVFEVNVGETIPLEIIRENEKASTIVVKESLNKDIVDWNDQIGGFAAKDKGGKAIIRITCNLSGFNDILIQVTVGDGSKTSPLFVKNAIELSQIGTENRPDNLCYTLTTDLDLSVVNSGVWTPISIANENGFTGYFTFNGHTISNLNLTGTDYSVAGLFSKIGTGGYVTGLNLQNVTINGNYTSVGAIAGTNLGTIEYVVLSNAEYTVDSSVATVVGGVVGVNNGTVSRSQILGLSVTSLNESSFVGGVVGVNESLSSIRATIDRTRACVNLTSSNVVGGIAGKNFGGIVINSYTDSLFTESQNYGAISSNGETGAIGGIVGLNEFKSLGSGSLDAVVKDTYSVVPITADITEKGSIIGKNINESEAQIKINRIYGNYYISTLTGISEGIGSGAYVFENVKLGNGTYGKTYDELLLSSTYFSFINVAFADVYWVFDRVWVLDGVNLPTLNYTGPFVSNSLNSIQEEGKIDSVADLMNIRADSTTLAGTYLLSENLDLSGIDNWIPIGSSDSPFVGTFIADIDPITGKNYIISGLQIASGNSGTQGLFGYVGKQGVVDGVILKDCIIRSGTTVGAIVAVNEGTVVNCFVQSTSVSNVVGSTSSLISTASTQSNVMLGGVVGQNLGTVQDCGVNAGAMVQLNSSSGNSAYSVGGVVGVNESTGTISYCYSKSLIQTSFPKGSAGGVVGSNYYVVEKSYYQGKLNGSFVANAYSYVGGIAGFNNDAAQVRYCFTDSSAEISGYQVGGLLGLSYGKLSESYSEAIITGVYAGGLAFGFIRGGAYDCYSGTYLIAYNSNSVKSGFAHYVEKINDVMATLNTCFARNTFSGEGTNYYETQQNCRIDEPWLKNGSGELYGCIYDKEIGGIAKRSDAREYWYAKAVDWIPGATEVLSYYRQDLGLTTAQSQGGDNFIQFRDNGYDDSIWKFETGLYPSLRNVVVEGQTSAS